MKIGEEYKNIFRRKCSKKLMAKVVLRQGYFNTYYTCLLFNSLFSNLYNIYLIFI